MLQETGIVATISIRGYEKATHSWESPVFRWFDETKSEDELLIRWLGMNLVKLDAALESTDLKVELKYRG